MLWLTGPAVDLAHDRVRHLGLQLTDDLTPHTCSCVVTVHSGKTYSSFVEFHVCVCETERESVCLVQHHDNNSHIASVLFPLPSWAAVIIRPEDSLLLYLILGL